MSTTKQTFSVDWPHGHMTADGDDVEIVKTDLKSDYPIVAIITRKSGHQLAEEYDADGYECGAGAGRTFDDLVNKPAPVADEFEAKNAASAGPDYSSVTIEMSFLGSLWIRAYKKGAQVSNVKLSEEKAIELRDFLNHHFPA